MEKHIRKFYAIAFLALASSYPLAARSSMMARRQIPIEKVIAQFGSGTDEKSKHITAAAELARSGFGIKELYVIDRGSDAVALANLRVDDITSQMSHAIHALPDWQKPVTAQIKSQLKKSRKYLQDTMPEDAWAWVEYQIDEKDTAKSRVVSLYNKEFEHVMTLTHAVSGLGHTPMDEAEYLSKVLIEIGTPSEKSEVESKLQKMKVHVSNLPQMQIMT